MNYEYAKTRDGVFVRTDERLEKRKKHKQVDEELKLENEIELLEGQIEDRQTALKNEDHVGLTSYALAILVIFIITILSRNILFGLFCAFATPVYFLVLKIGGYIKNPFKVIRNQKAIKLQIEFLSRSLNITRDKLEELKASKSERAEFSFKERYDATPADVIDLTPYNKNYRQEMIQRLEFLAQYKKLRKRFKKGTLEQDMQESFSPEEIAYINESLGGGRKRRKEKTSR